MPLHILKANDTTFSYDWILFLTPSSGILDPIFSYPVTDFEVSNVTSLTMAFQCQNPISYRVRPHVRALTDMFYWHWTSKQNKPIHVLYILLAVLVQYWLHVCNCQFCHWTEFCTSIFYKSKKFHSVTITHMQPVMHDTIHKQSHVYHTRHCGSVVDRWAHGTASADCVHRSWTARTHHIKVLRIYTVSPAIAGGQIL